MSSLIKINYASITLKRRILNKEILIIFLSDNYTVLKLIFFPL